MGKIGEAGVAHPHPNYVLVWGVLVVLLVLGISAGWVGHPVLATALIFSVAALKAFLVAANYMHLRFEPWFIRLIVLGGLACVVIVLVALIPDVVYVYGR